MGTKMLTTEEDLKLAEIHSKEDERMFGHLEDGEMDGQRVDDVEYCQSMAKRYLWPSWQRLQASCRRVMNQKAGLQIIEQDRELPLAHELTPIQIKLWKIQALNLIIAAKRYGIHVVRAEEILRRYQTS